TASRAVMKDVRRELAIQDVEAIITPKTFDRPELVLKVVKTASGEKGDALVGQLRGLPALLREPSGGFFQPCGRASNCGIVFCPHVRGQMGIEEQAQRLQQHFRVSVGIFSGKSPYSEDQPWEEKKRDTARRFKENELTLLVATKAFGMGIDKPNIRYTIHLGIPSSLEAFYQEAGRAGRDRRQSMCVVLFSDDHPDRSRQLLDLSIGAEEVARVFKETRDYSTDDDVSRMMFFHKKSFLGVASELKAIGIVVDLIGELDRPKQCDLPFGPPGARPTSTDDGRGVIEKALHRLVLLGVIRDYTVD
ncbi:MAG: hypothetical protein FJY85_12390, partial [Deltaproteobacteria bacterium]|nr:hypothetical protein [Deltaproteobacteria bacterium]